MPLTLRLNQEEEKALDAIKDVTNIKTSSGCLKTMILNFETDNKMFQLYIKENKALKEELALIKETILMRQECKKLVNKHQSKLTYLAGK